MAIAFGSIGATAVGTTSLAIAYPASISAGDLLVMVVANKYPTNGPSTPGGWTAPANNQGSGGAGASGVDQGNVYCTVFVKVADGSETGSFNLSVPSGNASVGAMLRYTKAAGKTWAWACANGSFNVASSTWSVTAGSDPGVTAGDMVVVGSGINSDNYTWSLESITATSVTFGSTTERQDGGTTNGDDCGMVVADALAASGTGSAAPNLGMKASGSAVNSPAGASVFLRLRELALGLDPLGVAGFFGV